MRYAIIADIHGNITALNAILEDCKTQNIDQYLFLGDYYGDFPMINQVITRIREIDNALYINGNKEERLIQAMNTKPQERTNEQFAPLYWHLDNITAENFRFIKELPDKLSFSIGKLKCYIAHSPSQHFNYGIVDSFNGRTFYDRFGKDYTNHQEYLAYINDKLQADKLPDVTEGIYIFGHWHTQWYANIENRLLINAGSCGMPLDFNVDAPYTILDTYQELSVIERRINYDITVPIKALKESDLYQKAPFWYDLSILDFENAKVHLWLFLEFVHELALSKNDLARPYSNELWQEAITLYSKKINSGGF
ncbi:MAG: metallophosphoesterase family protein [Erysipelotrichales bacterium]|nr:metallophosphoesterase family protein [Erysipelotrichales bacterium]